MGLNKRRDSRDNNNKDPVDDSENMNPEDVHMSLRSTANAIQNYSFEAKTSSSSTTTANNLTSDCTDLASLTDKMTSLDIGPVKMPESERMVTKINIQNSSTSKGKSQKIYVYRISRIFFRNFVELISSVICWRVDFFP